MNFVLGEVARISAEFRNSSGALADPTNVFFKYMLPNLTITTLTYGTDAALVKDATGQYHVDISLDTYGVYKWKFYSTVTVQAAETGNFSVNDDDFN